MATKLTAKEVNYLSDLLTFEESACKKANMYAKTLTDPQLSEAMQALAADHKKRFETLLAQLS